MSDFSGHLELLAARRDHGRTVLAHQAFRAPFHLSKPYWDDAARVLLLHVVNPTAGILAGDRLETRIAVDPGAALAVTTPSASRVFRMRSGLAQAEQHFQVAAGAWLDVSPEPLVLHAGARYRQATRIDLERGAGVFFLEPFFPGRLGHGEAWSWSELAMSLEVRWGGELVLREQFATPAEELRTLARHFGTGDASCFANIVLFPPDVRGHDESTDKGRADWQTAIAALHRPGVWVGLSALRRAGWSIKVVASGPLLLRDTLAEIRRRLVSVLPALACDPRKL